MNKLNRLLASAAVGAFAFAGAAWAETTLTVSSWAPPTHHMNAEVLPMVIAKIEEATGGDVKGEIKYGIAPPPAQMDLVMDGAVDMAWIFHGYQPGRFIASKLIELPGYPGDAEAASAAYWKVHEEHLAALDEHRGVKLIALFTHGPGQFHTDADVNSIDDLNGLKIRIGGGVAGAVGEALGVTGVRVPAPKVYETLASDVADGVAMDVASRTGFKLTEVAKNLYEMPGGFYRGSFALIMSQEAFDNLPADAQKAIDEMVVGGETSAAIGAIWAKNDAAALEATKATEGNSVRIASDADQAKFQEIADKVRMDVIQELTDAGVDGQAAYDLVMSSMQGMTN